MEQLQINHQLPLNPHPSLTMLVDINSCFASIEQQANPLLRGRPVVVAAYTTPRGCILAASTEAKKLGIKTGMRVATAKVLCDNLVVLQPDPPKYRWVNQQLVKIFYNWTAAVQVKSIDEAVLDLSQSPEIRTRSVEDIGREIKKQIHQRIGEKINVSIGIGTNYFWAKTAAGYRKPDGLVKVDKYSWRELLKQLELETLSGIGPANRGRLAGVGVLTPTQFLNSPLLVLQAAFQSVAARYWYMRLRGWEVDKVEYKTKTIGHSYALPRPTNDDKKLDRLLYKLVVKTGRRLRGKLFQAGGIRVGCLFSDQTWWQQGRKVSEPINDDLLIFRKASQLLRNRPKAIKVSNLTVNCFFLTPMLGRQLPLFETDGRLGLVTEATDEVNNRYGEFKVVPARIVGMEREIVDRVSFGQTGIEEVR